MNNRTRLTLKLIVIIFTMVACEKSTKVDSLDNPNKPKPVTISGVIADFQDTIENNTIKLYIHDAGTTSTLSYTSQIDKNGSFLFQFERYLPQDVVIEYGTNFKVLVHPDDSIHIKFQTTNDRVQLLKTLEFSGDASNENSSLRQYQLDYYSNYFQNLNNYDFDNIDKYKLFRDSLHAKMKAYLSDFKKIYKPNNEIEQWIYWDIEMDRAINLLEFTRQYRTKNKLPQTWMPSEDYYDFMNSPLSMDESALTNSKATRWFINKYLFEYVYPRTIIDFESKTIIGKLLVASKGIDASLLKNIKIDTEKNALLRQLCYSAFFNEELDKKSIEIYDDNRKLIEQNITEPFLKYPLIANYVDTKVKIDEPSNLTDFKTSSVKDADLNSFLEDIEKNNQGKLIYIDIWATWCSPCIEEMKKSKELHEQLKAKGVECIFVCIDSAKDKCNATLAELDLKGQFYFLSKKQSNLLREKFSISGIPHYLLIDKTGNIIDSGSHLRPSGQIIMNRIEENL